MRIDNGRKEAKTTGKLTGETIENIPRSRIASPCQRGELEAGLLRFTALQVESLESGAGERLIKSLLPAQSPVDLSRVAGGALVDPSIHHDTDSAACPEGNAENDAAPPGRSKETLAKRKTIAIVVHLDPDFVALEQGSAQWEIAQLRKSRNLQQIAGCRVQGPRRANTDPLELIRADRGAGERLVYGAQESLAGSLRRAGRQAGAHRELAAQASAGIENPRGDLRASKVHSYCQLLGSHGSARGRGRIAEHQQNKKEEDKGG